MVLRRSDPRTLIVSAVMALMFAPDLALAQQPDTTATPPRQIGNRTDYKERQPTTAEICDSGGKESVDCSQQDDKALEKIRRQIDAPEHVRPSAGSATIPPSGTR